MPSPPHDLNLTQGPNKGLRLGRVAVWALSAFLGLSLSVPTKPAHGLVIKKHIMTTIQGDLAINHHDTALVPVRMNCLRSK